MAKNEDSYSAYTGMIRVPLVKEMKYVCNINRQLKTTLTRYSPALK